MFCLCEHLHTFPHLTVEPAQLRISQRCFMFFREPVTFTNKIYLKNQKKATSRTRKNMTKENIKHNKIPHLFTHQAFCLVSGTLFFINWHTSCTFMQIITDFSKQIYNISTRVCVKQHGFLYLRVYLHSSLRHFHPN